MARGDAARPPKTNTPQHTTYNAYLMKQRIQKILANAGIDSRRNIETMVRDGRVSVNGTVRRELPILVDPGKDKIVVDGEQIKMPRGFNSEERIYVLMNKPRGI